MGFALGCTFKANRLQGIAGFAAADPRVIHVLLRTLFRMWFRRLPWRQVWAWGPERSVGRNSQGRRGRRHARSVTKRAELTIFRKLLAPRRGLCGLGIEVRSGRLPSAPGVGTGKPPWEVVIVCHLARCARAPYRFTVDGGVRRWPDSSEECIVPLRLSALALLLDLGWYPEVPTPEIVTLQARRIDLAESHLCSLSDMAAARCALIGRR